MARRITDAEELHTNLIEYGFDYGDIRGWDRNNIPPPSGPGAAMPPGGPGAAMPAIFQFMPLPSPHSLENISPKLVVYNTESKAEGKTFQWHKVDDFVDCFGGYGDVPLKVVFVVHGFKNDAEEEWVVQLKNALLDESEKKVVVVVGWTGGANLLAIRYRHAVANVEVVGEWLGQAVKSLKKRYPSYLVHGIGHSLGAHLMGKAGRTSEGGFYRITGLDPAGPRFDHPGDKDRRLRPSDATEMVDVIHTSGYTSDNAWFLPKTVHFGILLPLGKLDFFPSYGKSPQPGTEKQHSWTALVTNHSRAYEYFIWSVQNPGKFQTKIILDGTPGIDEPVEKCKAAEFAAEMGYYGYKHGDKQLVGNYYLVPKNINYTE